MSEVDLRHCKIVCHGAGTPEGWWTHKPVREIFSALGLAQTNFVVFKRPTLFSNIQIPRPAAEEHNFVHRSYAEFGHRVGAALLSQRNLPSRTEPVWLSKSRLGQGVQGVLNEEEMFPTLERGGVEIVHPQDLSIADQVSLFATRKAVTGVVGSAFHTSILWPPWTRLVGLAIYDHVNSNYAIADKCNDNRVTYHRADVTRPDTNVQQKTRFNDAFVLTDPECAARKILEVIDLEQ
jgi:capsular polysaccharide biosynthesis protein